MGHTCVAVRYNSRAGRDKTIPFLLISSGSGQKNKWIGAVNRDLERSKRVKAGTYGSLVHTSTSHFGHNVKHKGF